MTTPTNAKLVERLRTYLARTHPSGSSDTIPGLFDEAADRIESLAKRVEELEGENANPNYLECCCVASENISKLTASNTALLTLIFTRTRICPFGGGRDGMRTCCKFGSPGCACDDWVEENHDALAALPKNEVVDGES